MNVTFIGTGNCATSLARLCLQKGHVVKQIIGRNEAAGRALAEESRAGYISLADEPDTNVDLVITAVSDNALATGLEGINFGDKLVVHTAGAVPMNALRNITSNFGIFYPLQSLSKEIKVPPPMPFVIEANNPSSLKFLKDFAFTLTDRVEEMSEDKRIRLHAAAVIVNNFTNYLYTVAQDFCEKEGINFDLLKPLIAETANRIHDKSPAEVQTGPAARKDIVTLDKHLRLLSAYPKLRTLYMRMTDSIMNP